MEPKMPRTTLPRLHKPKKGDTFTLGFGPGAETCDVTSVSKDRVDYEVRRDGSAGFFHTGSPQHQMVRFWGGE